MERIYLEYELRMNTEVVRRHGLEGSETGDV